MAGFALLMKRFLVMKGSNGSQQSHGTLIYLENQDIAITSHPLDDAFGIEYYVTTDRGQHKVLSKTELSLPAPGIPISSIPPHVYQIKLEGHL